MTQKTISILGSTGSVGESTLSLIEQDINNNYSIIALTANTNSDFLIEQARQFKPQFVALADPSGLAALEAGLNGSGIRFAAGEEAILEAACMRADWTMAAIVGSAGLKPTLEAVKHGRTVALANKEALVCAGPLFMQAAATHGTTLLPVDSEHNAIFQCFDPAQKDHIRRIILTASGGPFRNASLAEMKNATRESALNHPTWTMGSKISIDSATMMNKGLEIIEACHLFDLKHDQVDVLVHPSSIVHGLVEYADGGLLAQLGSPDMRTPIAHALAWPDRMETQVNRLSLDALTNLEFEAPDLDRFPAINLARQAMGLGGTAPAILNAANEIAVDAFLTEQIGFLDITHTVELTLTAAIHGEFNLKQLGSFEDVYEADRWARQKAQNLLQDKISQ